MMKRNVISFLVILMATSGIHAVRLNELEEESALLSAQGRSLMSDSLKVKLGVKVRNDIVSRARHGTQKSIAIDLDGIIEGVMQTVENSDVKHMSGMRKRVTLARNKCARLTVEMLEEVTSLLQNNFPAEGAQSDDEFVENFDNLRAKNNLSKAKLFTLGKEYDQASCELDAATEEIDFFRVELIEEMFGCALTHVEVVAYELGLGNVEDQSNGNVLYSAPLKSCCCTIC